MSDWGFARPKAAAASPVNSLTRQVIEPEELLPAAKEGRLWAILDACNEPEIPPLMLDELGPDRAASLYRGEAAVEQAAIAPYLAQVDEKLFQWIRDNLWGKPWGCFLIASSDLETLRSHFRKFLNVRDPDGEPMYFRYYDPRLLKAFLESCVDKELREFLAQAQALVLETGGQVNVFRLPAQQA